MSNLLAVEFIAERPALAARQIERFSAAEISEFLQDLSPEPAGSLMGKLSSHLMTELGRILPAETLAAILSVSSTIAVSAIVAHLNPERYSAIVAAGTESQKGALSRLFRIQSVSLSGYAMPLFIQVAPDQTCAQCKTELETMESTTDMPVIAVNSDGRYLGIVPTLAILATKNADRPISVFIDEVAPLPGHAKPDTVLSLEQWNRHPILPVVDNRRILVGAVALNDLLKIARRAPVSAAPTSHSLFNVVDLYFTLCADTLDLLLGSRGK